VLKYKTSEQTGSALEAGEITMTLPDKLNSRNQKYVVTHKTPAKISHQSE
jgi:hypothetical protein